MTLHYYPETDSLYIELKPEPSAETVELRDGLNVDFGSDGEVVGFDIDHASARLDLSQFSFISVPPLPEAGATGVALQNPRVEP